MKHKIAYATKPGNHIERLQKAFAAEGAEMLGFTDASGLIGHLSGAALPDLVIVHSSLHPGTMFTAPETNGGVTTGIKAYRLIRERHPTLRMIVIADDRYASRALESITDLLFMPFRPKELYHDDDDLIHNAFYMLNLAL